MIKHFKHKHIFLFNTLLFILFLSCTSTKKNSIAPTFSQLNQKNIGKQVNSLLDKGIDFFAEGKMQSNWKLEMNFDDSVFFSADDGLSLTFAFNQLKRETDHLGVQYYANLKGSTIKISINNKVCASNNANVMKEVVFSFNTSIYSGCGNFLANEKLNGKWILEKIAGKTLTPEDFNRKPTIILDLNNESVAGNDGCNNFNGQFQVQGKRIKFSKLSSTKMSCKNHSVATIFSKNINDQLVDYFFKDGKLYLYLSDDSLLVFVKN